MDARSLFIKRQLEDAETAMNAGEGTVAMLAVIAAVSGIAHQVREIHELLRTNKITDQVNAETT